MSQILMSTSGYISQSPISVNRVLICSGSTGGTWSFRNGSTNGAIRFQIGSQGSTPSNRTNVVGVINYVAFSSKCYLTKGGANKGLAFVLYT